METKDLRTEIGEMWHQVNRELHDRMRVAFRDSSITPMVMVMLRIVEEHPGITISELARRSGTVKSHVSKVIDQFVTRGYLEKRSDPDDQRLLRIYPTAAAEAVKAQMMGKAKAAWSEAMAGVPEPDLQGLASGLRALLKSMQDQKAPD